MNKHTTSLLVAAALLTGCNGLKQAVVTPVVSDQLITNVVIIALPSGGFATNISVTAGMVTNWVINPVTQGAVSSVGALVPPWGTIGVALLGLLASGYASWLNRRNKSIAISTIQGVEQFRNELQRSGDKGQKLDEKLVEYLVWAQRAAAVAEAADELVQEATKNVPVVPDAGAVSKIVNEPVKPL